MCWIALPTVDRALTAAINFTEKSTMIEHKKLSQRVEIGGFEKRRQVSIESLRDAKRVRKWRRAKYNTREMGR